MANQVETSSQPVSAPWVTFELVALAVSLFFSAMGANAYVQFVVPYLVEAAGWSSARAVLVLILAFSCMPLGRLLYRPIERRLGDHTILLVGNVLFVVFAGLLAWGRGPWIILPAGLALSCAGAMVFTAGPLRILAATPAHRHSAAAGIFFATNFLAWFVGVTLQGQVARVYGLAPTPFVAMVPTLIGLFVLLFLPRHARQESGDTPGDFLKPWGSGLVRMVMCFMGLSAVAFGLMFGALSQSLAVDFGPALMSAALSSFYLARLPGSLAAGLMISRWGERRFLAAVFGLTGLMLLAVSANSTTYAIVLGAIVVLGFQQATVPVAAMAMVGSLAGGGARQAGFGLLFAASELGVALSLALAQAASDLLGNPSSVFLIFGAVYVSGGVAAWQLHAEGPAAIYRDSA